MILAKAGFKEGFSLKKIVKMLGSIGSIAAYFENYNFQLVCMGFKWNTFGGSFLNYK